jgi:sialic acid synthase SpsE
LKQIAGYKRPIILSTGMATLEEVKDAVKTIYSSGNKKLILLHCTSNYPSAYKDVNLKAMDTLKEEFDVPVGYSDHTLGIEVSVAAVAMGTSVIEKHFTLSKDFSGPDHRASASPDEFCALVRAVRNTEKAMGSGAKSPCRSEEKIKKIARKSIVAACDIKKGATLAQAMLSIKRPGTGIEPRYLDGLIGRKANIDIEKGEVLSRDLII